MSITEGGNYLLKNLRFELAKVQQVAAELELRTVVIISKLFAMRLALRLVNKRAQK